MGLFVSFFPNLVSLIGQNTQLKGVLPLKTKDPQNMSLQILSHHDPKPNAQDVFQNSLNIREKLKRENWFLILTDSK